MGKRQARAGPGWAGVDAGMGHLAAVVDEIGVTLWSQKTDKHESAILTGARRDPGLGR